MLKKIISIKNVGRFVNSTAAGNPQPPRHVLIFGANGFGKTVPCALLRSLQSGDASYITGRKTLAVPPIFPSTSWPMAAMHGSRVGPSGARSPRLQCSTAPE